MPETIDLLSNRKFTKSLGKSHNDLFGHRFLTQMAKENKDNLKNLLTGDTRRNAKRSYKSLYNNRDSSKFFSTETLNEPPVSGSIGYVRLLFYAVSATMAI